MVYLRAQHGSELQVPVTSQGGSMLRSSIRPGEGDGGGGAPGSRRRRKWVFRGMSGTAMRPHAHIPHCHPQEVPPAPVRDVDTPPGHLETLAESRSVSGQIISLDVETRGIHMKLAFPGLRECSNVNSNGRDSPDSIGGSSM